MDDLIDLSGPEEKPAELPPPLIPSPDNDSPRETQRRSVDNNPFDMVLRKTSEYVAKSEDPFEAVYEKATSARRSLSPQKPADGARRKRHSDVLKMNKTLDESLIAARPSEPRAEESELPSILVEPPSPGHSLSILNQSAMNDSFSDKLHTPRRLEQSILNASTLNDSLSASDGSSDCFLKSVVAQTVQRSVELLGADRVCKLRRSFSQGDRASPRRFREKRSMSIAGNRKLLGEDSVPSILFEDPLNRAFMPREQTEYSSVGDYSELSSITRLGSVNCGSFLSGKSSNDTANRGFIESGGNMEDLIARFNSLRMKSSGSWSARGELERIDAANGSDSVFLEDEKKDTIISQANILAKTFEELAEKSRGSSSSSDNLQSTKPPSGFSGFSTETSSRSQNLIDLPSPSKPITPNATKTPNTSRASPKTANETEFKEKIRELEQEFLPPVKKAAAATLLLDLEKIVKEQNKPEVMNLLENLEAALGIKCENNTDLLTICCQEPERLEEAEKPREVAQTEPEDDKKPAAEPEGSRGDSASASSSQKLILDIQQALAKVLEGCKGEPAVLLESLNKVLSPKPRALVKPIVSPQVLPRGQKTPPLPSAAVTSAPRIAAAKPQPAPRRSLPKVTSPKRPDAATSTVNRRSSSGSRPEPKKPVERKMKPTLPVLDTAKLRKKSEPAKKGPLKALAPLGAMARALRPQTPKREKPAPLNIATSTPDPVVLPGKPKAKPVASSTPDVTGRGARSKSLIPQSPRHNVSWNISPVSPNAKETVPDVLNKSDSCKGRAVGSVTPRSQRLSVSARMNTSVERSLKSPSPLIGGFKVCSRRSEPVQSPRAAGRTPASPLREKNAVKVKPMNLNTKFRRRSDSLGSVGKENKY